MAWPFTRTGSKCHRCEAASTAAPSSRAKPLDFATSTSQIEPSGLMTKSSTTFPCSPSVVRVHRQRCCMRRTVRARGRGIGHIRRGRTDSKNSGEQQAHTANQADGRFHLYKICPRRLPALRTSSACPLLSSHADVARATTSPAAAQHPTRRSAPCNAASILPQTPQEMQRGQRRASIQRGRRPVTGVASGRLAAARLKCTPLISAP